MTIAANRPIKTARSRAVLGRALGWWLAELRACRDDLRRYAAARGRRGMTIEAGERYWLLRQGQRPIGQIDVRAGDAAGLSRLIPPAARRRAVIVEIPPERALAKIVSFPAGAKGQLDRILGFEIARHFPFPADRVYFQHRVVGEGDDGTSAIAVEIVAVPREIVDGICLTLAENGLRPAAIAVAGAADAKPLFLPTATLAVVRRDAAPATRLLGFAAFLAGLAVLVSWPLAQRAELNSLDREIAALKPRAEMALRSGEAERRVGARSAAILALRAGRPPLVAALDALSRAVPDGSWLLSLSISAREMVLDGLSPSAASVALALEKSRDVTGIVFRSPINREASGLEHFQLGATLGVAQGTPPAALQTAPQSAQSGDLKP
ncbi:MAG TPA: PilN domain-containing protein [Stellaceae bacterium]|nr:PilN domain-containing protein [Stellaceae bacterium]